MDCNLASVMMKQVQFGGKNVIEDGGNKGADSFILVCSPGSKNDVLVSGVLL